MTLPSDPEFLLQYMEDIDSDCSDDEFDGYVDDEVINALPGEMNNGGAAMEMMDMIMNGCNIAAEEDVEMDSEGEEGVGAEGGVFVGVEEGGGVFVGEGGGVEEVHAMESGVSNGAGDTPSNGASGSIPVFTEHRGVVKNLAGVEPLDCFNELFPEDLIENIVMVSNRYGNQYIASHAEHLKNHPKARVHGLTQGATWL